MDKKAKFEIQVGWCAGSEIFNLREMAGIESYCEAMLQHAKNPEDQWIKIKLKTEED